MTVILTDSGDDFQRYSFSVGESSVLFTSTYELFDAVSADKKEQLIVIGPSIKMETVKSVAEHFRTSRPSLGVVLIRKRLDVGVMAEAIRHGIREVVAADDASAIVAACKRSLELTEKLIATNNSSGTGIDSRGKVVIVFSAKGGCGKTTVSVNFAQALASMGAGRVALVDLDLQFGDVAVALQLDPRKTISDAISMQSSLDSVGVQSLMTSKYENLDLLLAPTNPTDVEFISAELVDRIIEFLRNEYAFIVIDTPPAFTDVILKVFDTADKCLLISTLDMPSLKNMKIVINTLESLNFSKGRLDLVLNRSDSKTGIAKTEAEEIIGDKFRFAIPNSEDVSSSTNKGEPIVISKPKHPVSRSIRAMASATLEQFGGSSYSKKKTWFGRNRT